MAKEQDNRPSLLWVEEDYLEPFEMALRTHYDVARAFTLAQAEKAIDHRRFDVVVLDVMIPIEEEDLAYGYTVVNTTNGDHSGLEFYRRHAKHFRAAGTVVLVHTICGDDSGIRKQFLDLGLPAHLFVSKVSFCSVNELTGLIDQAVNGRASNEARSQE